MRNAVVVAVDGSRNGMAVVDLGVAEARRRGSALIIVHVWPGRHAGPFRSGATAPGIAAGRHLLDLAARRAEHREPGLEVMTELAGGSAFGTITERSASARLLVIGHRDEVLTRPSWGSTAAYLAHHSACPLLVHRGAAPDRGPVVVAVSGTPGHSATVLSAVEEAALCGTRLVAMHVWTHPDAAGSRIPSAARREADERLTAALAPAVTVHPEVPVERLVLSEPDVGYTLGRAAHRGRLLVAGMGASGRVAELLYGGLSVSHRPPGPVLLVPPGWEHPDLAAVAAHSTAG